jgi:virulence-associated protein VagC
MIMAKLFKHGGSRAVLLPKAFHFEGTEVLIEK